MTFKIFVTQPVKINGHFSYRNNYFFEVSFFIILYNIHIVSKFYIFHNIR